MLAQIRKLRTDEGGFTLIELLMVIVILGVLAGIVVLSVGGISDRGQASACKADGKTVQVAEEAYFASPTAGNGAYGSEQELVDGKFLASLSTYVDVASTGTAYTLSGVGKCATLPIL